MPAAPEFPSVAVTEPVVAPAPAVNVQVNAPAALAVIVEPTEEPTVQAALGTWLPERPGIVTVTVPP
jgi:hypothetical protein